MSGRRVGENPGAVDVAAPQQLLVGDGVRQHRRAVVHRLELILGEELVEQLTVADVSLDRPQPRVLGHGWLDVEAHTAHAVGQQALDQDVAEEAGASRDEYGPALRPNRGPTASFEHRRTLAGGGPGDPDGGPASALQRTAVSDVSSEQAAIPSPPVAG